MSEMTLPSRQMIPNSNPENLRPITLPLGLGPLGHGVLRVDGEELLLLWVLVKRDTASSGRKFKNNNLARKEL